MSAREDNIAQLRLPPHSIEAEQAVLGVLLMRNAALDQVGDVVAEADFYRAEHRTIWRVVSRLIEANQPADTLTVADALRGEGRLQDVGGVAYLYQLAQGAPSTVNIRRYAEIVRDRAITRRLAEAGAAITDAAYNTAGRDASEILDEAERRILEVGEMRARKGAVLRSMPELLTEAMSALDELHRNPASVTGIATGFVDLDDRTTGLQRGDLVVIAGRPSMGKTSLAMNIAEHVGIQLKLPTIVFSMEMSGQQLARRMLGSVGKVDGHRLRTGRVDANDWERLGQALGHLNAAPIEIDETGALTVAEMRARARRKAREHAGLGLVVIDYLQLMTGAGGREETRASEVGEITRSLKNMARELNCPVVALSQLNRGLENRANKRPVMADLRESGSIEQDADVILFVYRDEVYNSESPDKGTAEIIIGKQRNGPIGTVRLAFLARYASFENYAGDQGYSSPAVPRRAPKRAFTEKDD